jgi:hypothetical protein
MKLNANQVIRYIEGQGKKFPHSALKRDTCILAGGSVANAIISIWKQKQYPINDFDIFVNHNSVDYLDFRNSDSIATVTDDTSYPAQMTSRLHIMKRETFGECDFISVAVTDEHKNLREPNNELFYTTVLNSFDLNCVQAGIYWDHNRLEYVLTTTPEFDRFLQRNKVEVVNVHSNVTFLRMLKKADELQSAIDVMEELQVIRVSCNPANLNELTEEQAIKHVRYLEELPRMKRKVLSGIDRTVKEDRSAFVPEGIFQAIYDSFADLGKLNKRPLKIKIVRAYIQGTREQKINILQFLDIIPYTFAEIVLSVPDLLTWISTKPYHKEEIRQYLYFHIQNPTFHFLLRAENFDTSYRRMLVLKENTEAFVASFFIKADYEDRLYSDSEFASILLSGKVKQKELEEARKRNHFMTNFDLEVEEALEEIDSALVQLEELRLDSLIEEACNEINRALGYNLMTKELFNRLMETWQ